MKPEISNHHDDTRALFENSGTGIIVIEEDGVISLANEEFALKTGYAIDEIEGKIKWTELVHESDIDRMVKLHHLRRENPDRIMSAYDFRYKKRSSGFGDALLSIKMVPGTGKSIVSLIDMTGRNKALEALRYQRALQQLLVDLATGFINILPEKVDSALDQMLMEIGAFTEMDRVYIFMHDYTAQTTSNTHEWCADGVSSQLSNNQNLSFDTIPDILKAHDQGLFFHIPDVSDLPVDNSLRLILELQDIKSLMLLPLQHNETDFGFVGFDAVRDTRYFSDSEIDLLKVAAEIISNALARQRKAHIIQKNLNEKNVLLAEIHHRVKSNMAIISSLMALQADFFSKNPDSQTILEEMQHRIKSMALVHEMVYENENLTEIDFGRLLERLVSDLRASYDHKKIDVSIRTDEILLNMNSSVPLSLLANELILNTFKHAFNGRTHGAIDIRFNKKDGGCSLAVSDNGIGVPDPNSLHKPETLGYTIIRTLVDQLGGEFNVLSADSGLTVEVRFPHLTSA